MVCGDGVSAVAEASARAAWRLAGDRRGCGYAGGNAVLDCGLGDLAPLDDSHQRSRIGGEADGELRAVQPGDGAGVRRLSWRAVGNEGLGIDCLPCGLRIADYVYSVSLPAGQCGGVEG